MPKKRLEDAQAPVQGFAPRVIMDIADDAEPDTTNWMAFCFPEDDVTYQINGAGETATIVAGSIRVVGVDVLTIKFSDISTAAKCEVM
jgi:hypothetical protein